MASVKIILREDKINKRTGLSPIYLRIIKNRKIKFISLGIKVESKYWNNEKMSLKKGAPNYQELNNYIIQKRAEAERVSIKMELSSIDVSINKIKEEIKGSKPVLFFEFTDEKLEGLKNNLSYASYYDYKSCLKKVEKFWGNRNITFNDFDMSFIKRFEAHLYNELNNKPLTVKKNLKIIKLMFNHAINDGVINSSVFTFKNHTIKAKAAVKNYLNEQQYESLLNYDATASKMKEIYYDMFIFASYAAGLRFADVLEIKWENFNENESRLTKIIRKTKRKHQFILPKKAILIIEKYRTENKKTTDFIFPLLINGFDYSNPKTMYTAKNNNNSYANKVLHEIEKDLKLPFPLTFHVSRHTFATRALNKGMRIEHVSKLMDHSNITITQIYAKIVNKELDNAMDIMND